MRDPDKHFWTVMFVTLILLVGGLIALWIGEMR